MPNRPDNGLLSTLADIPGLVQIPLTPVLLPVRAGIPRGSVVTCGLDSRDDQVSGPVSSKAPGGPAATPIGVFVLDDHEIVRRGIRGLLEAEPDIAVAGEAGTACTRGAGGGGLRSLVG